MGRAFRRELGGHPGPRSGAVQRTMPADMAHVSLVVRGDVPVAHVAHTPVPGDREQGERRPLPDEPLVPVRVCFVTAYAEKTARLLAAVESARRSGQPGVGL